MNKSSVFILVIFTTIISATTQAPSYKKNTCDKHCIYCFQQQCKACYRSLMDKSGKCSDSLLPVNTEPNCMVFYYDSETGKNQCNQCMPYHYMDEDFKCHELPGNWIVAESPCIFGEYSAYYDAIYCKICERGFPSSLNYGNQCIPFAEFRKDKEMEDSEIQAENNEGDVIGNKDLSEKDQNNEGSQKNKHFEFESNNLVGMRTENCRWGTFGSMGPECMRCENGYVSYNGHCREEKDRMDKGCAWRGTSRYDEEGCGPCDIFNGYFAVGDGFCKQFYTNGISEMINIQEKTADRDKLHLTVDL